MHHERWARARVVQLGCSSEACERDTHTSILRYRAAEPVSLDVCVCASLTLFRCCAPSGWLGQRHQRLVCFWHVHWTRVAGLSGADMHCRQCRLPANRDVDSCHLNDPRYASSPLEALSSSSSLLLAPASFTTWSFAVVPPGDSNPFTTLRLSVATASARPVGAILARAAAAARRLALAALLPLPPPRRLPLRFFNLAM